MLMGSFRLGLLSLMAAATVCAGPAQGDPRLDRLFSKFIAPCCWRENLNVHQSPKADDLRQSIREMVAAGRSDVQIESSLVSQYGRRVLAMPDGAEGLWLLWMPFLIFSAGAALVVWFIRRSTRHQQEEL